jgi:uncharacterized protein (DUF2235 family)
MGIPVNPNLIFEARRVCKRRDDEDRVRGKLSTRDSIPKNIVVYSDGTGQDGGVRPEQRVSNVYKLYRASRVSFEIAIDPCEQVVFYDPGLGTDIGATALTAPVRSFRSCWPR